MAVVEGSQGHRQLLDVGEFVEAVAVGALAVPELLGEAGDAWVVLLEVVVSVEEDRQGLVHREAGSQSVADDCGGVVGVQAANEHSADPGTVHDEDADEAGGERDDELGGTGCGGLHMLQECRAEANGCRPRHRAPAPCAGCLDPLSDSPPAQAITRVAEWGAIRGRESEGGGERGERLTSARLSTSYPRLIHTPRGAPGDGHARVDKEADKQGHEKTGGAMLPPPVFPSLRPYCGSWSRILAPTRSQDPSKSSKNTSSTRRPSAFAMSSALGRSGTTRPSS